MSLYTVLEIDSDANISTVKRQYRRLAKIHHPDRGGSVKMFQELLGAYEILNNPTTRVQYDLSLQYGVAQALVHQPEPLQKTNDIRFTIALHRTEFVYGTTRKLRAFTDILCVDCRGRCILGRTSLRCLFCFGGFLGACVRCESTGYMTTPGLEPCVSCHGTGSQKERKTLYVRVQPSTPIGFNQCFRGAGNEKYGKRCGDIVIDLQLCKQ